MMTGSKPVFKARTYLACCAILLPILTVPVSVSADDVSDQVAEAMQAYKDKDYPMAAQGLEIAAQMIRQLRGEGLTTLFPDPLKGWTADEPESQSAGAAMMGGGTTANRNYHKGSGEITIQFITDSPLMQSVMMMFNMPMMAQSSGMKVVRIKGQKAMVSKEDLTINLVIGGTMLVQIDGSDCEMEDLRAYAEAIDYNALLNTL